MSETLNDKLAAFFHAHAGEWIDGMRLAGIAGGYAWRSRCSDLRKRGMTIENRQRRVQGHKGHCQMWDFPTSECHCGGGVVVKSEYRFVPGVTGDRPAGVSGQPAETAAEVLSNAGERPAPASLFDLTAVAS